MADLVLDPETHTYRLDGKPLLSVSEILRSAGIAPASEFTNRKIEYAKDLGTYVHQACALDDRGELDEDSLDEAIRPYLAAWRAFREQERPEWLAIEQPLASECGNWAGTPDRVALFPEHETTRHIVEIKSGEMKKWHRIQAQGYLELIGEAIEGWRTLVYLKADGTFMIEHWAPSHTHLDVWAAAVVIATWKRQRESTP